MTESSIESLARTRQGDSRQLVVLIDGSLSMRRLINTEVSCEKFLQNLNFHDGGSSINYYFYADVCVLQDKLDQLADLGSGSRTVSAIIRCLEDISQGGVIILVTNSFPTDFCSPYEVKDNLHKKGVRFYVYYLGERLPYILNYLADDSVTNSEDYQVKREQWIKLT